MFKKILYPTDFSDVSKKALEYLKKLKEAGTKEVIVLHIIDEREIEKGICRLSWWTKYLTLCIIEALPLLWQGFLSILALTRCNLCKSLTKPKEIPMLLFF